ncbi:ATP/GTP-binding protein [Microbacterium karelineae]|uniref:ATP/GTP-binding protein n=1 Tax=Microbacterium karelineae TaxID=2654283 RepID=UPI0012EA6366|nr:ATP/GTP-binding protein [Microbacterium karelineae]
MPTRRAVEQHIAVFGESGSGKTVLASSFFGATQEPEFLRASLFDVIADDTGQGSRLHRNYLGMKDSARLPDATRFDSTSYAFTIRPKDPPNARRAKNRPFDAVRLVWHDYPGEWFEQGVSGQVEQRRRVDTFRALLGSDVALFLVDGQRLLDNAGEEERYLKSLFGNFRNGLLSLRDDLLDAGKPLVRFPRIWVMALSKADLLPDLDAFAFRDLLIGKAGEDIDELRKVIEGFVEARDALSVGEDFVLLSSARFEPDRIQVRERVGVDLVLPLAATLPLERHVRWAGAKRIPGKVAEQLLDSGAGALGVTATAVALLGKVPLPGPLRIAQGILGAVFAGPALEQAADLAGAKLREANATARAKHDYLAAMLTGFRLDLERGEQERVLLRSRR